MTERPAWFRTVALLACSAAMLLAEASGRTAAPGAVAPAEFRSIWRTLDAAWEGRDAAAFAELFTADGSLAFVDRGEVLAGRATIRDHFAARFPRFAADLRHRTSVRDASIVSADVGIVDGGVEIVRVGEGGEEPAVLKTFSIFTVMQRTAEGWRIRALRAYELPVTIAQDH